MVYSELKEIEILEEALDFLVILRRINKDRNIKLRVLNHDRNDIDGKFHKNTPFLILSNGN